MPATTMRLEEFNDRELLWIVHDLQDAEGWANAGDIADRAGITRPTQYRGKRLTDAEFAIYKRHCVGARFAYMRRIGVLEKHDKEPHLWRLSPLGEAIRTGKLTTQQERVLEGLDENMLVALVGGITRRYVSVNGHGTIRTLMRREWQHGTHKNRLREAGRRS